MKRSIVAVKRYVGSPDSLKEALSFCNGLGGLKGDDHIFIKPNLVGQDNRYGLVKYVPKV